MGLGSIIEPKAPRFAARGGILVYLLERFIWFAWSDQTDKTNLRQRLSLFCGVLQDFLC